MTKTARLYGSSLYDLAAEEGMVDELMEQTQQVRQIFREQPEYLKLLQEPSIPFRERAGMIDDAFGQGGNRYLVNFIKLLCERGYLGEYAGCCDEYTRRYYADHNLTEAVITSAVALDDTQKEQLKARLEKMSGKTVLLREKIDPALLAGIRVQMDGKELDGTVKGRMKELSRRLSEITV